VRAPCLSSALEEEVGAVYRYGIRGGLTAPQRAELVRPRAPVPVVVALPVERRPCVAAR
jgi:hypothetical protein